MLWSNEEVSIIVHMPESKSITLKFKGRSKIAAVKREIEEKEGFPTDQQCLISRNRGVLQDYRNLLFNRIADNSFLHLIVYPPSYMDILVETLTGERKILSISSSKNPAEIIEADLGLSSDHYCLKYNNRMLEMKQYCFFNWFPMGHF